MAKCVIFCASELNTPIFPMDAEDFIIAADGGLTHTQRLGLTPNLILGDFDSLGYTPEGAQVFPVEKDDTDAMLAIKQGLSLGYREFLLYGCLGGNRLDHTLANLQALQYLSDHGAFGYLVGSHQIATVIQGEFLQFSAAARGILSVFCMGSDCQDVTLQGLKYPLDQGTLTSGFPLGVSNHFTRKPATVSAAGSLLCLWDRKNGLPQGRAKL